MIKWIFFNLVECQKHVGNIEKEMKIKINFEIEFSKMLTKIVGKHVEAKYGFKYCFPKENAQHCHLPFV